MAGRRRFLEDRFEKLFLRLECVNAILASLEAICGLPQIDGKSLKYKASRRGTTTVITVTILLCLAIIEKGRITKHE